MDKKIVIEIVKESLKQVLEEPITDEKLDDVSFVGSESVLSSLGLVELLVSIQEELEDNHNVEFDWVNDKAMSAKNSPFKNINTLTDYIIKFSQ